jgi:hypothetical protein
MLRCPRGSFDANQPQHQQRLRSSEALEGALVTRQPAYDLTAEKLRFYDPFWQTVSDSPWKVNSPLTDVLAGAPKYGRVTKSCRL